MNQTQMMYRRIVRSGKKKLSKMIDINDTIERLGREGLNKIEISVAINLMACIIYFDNEVFPDNRIGKCTFCPTKPSISMASYNNPLDGYDPIEKYTVRVKELPKDLKESIRLILYEKDGSQTEDCYDKLPLVSYHQKLLSMAAHEVRHRLQKNGINMFSSNNSYVDKRINSYVLFSKRMFDSGKDYGEVKDIAMKAREFDARIVEKLILCKLHHGTNESKLCNLIKIESEIVKN